MKISYYFAIVLFLVLGYFAWEQTRSKSSTRGGEQVVQSSFRRPDPDSKNKSYSLTDEEYSREDDDVVSDEDIDRWMLDIKSMEYGREYKDLLSRIAEYYGKLDPETGKEWLLSLENSPENSIAFSVFGVAYAKEFGLESLDFFDDIRHPSFAESYINATTSQLSLEHPREALAFVFKRTKKLKNLEYSLRTIANIAALNGVDEALAIFQGHEMSEEYMEPILAGVANRIMSEEKWGPSMSSFLKEIQEIGREELIIAAVENVVAATGTSGFDELAEVLSGLPNSKWRDGGVSRFAKRIANKAPQSAVYWVNQIDDNNTRLETAITVMKSVDKFDPLLRKELIAELNLPPEDVNRLRSQFSD